MATVDAPESEDEEEKKQLDEEYAELTKKLKEVLGESVKEVKVTTRLTESPGCVVPDSSDPMAGMAHLFRQMGQEMPQTPLILEINPKHEMISKLSSMDDEKLFEESAWVLYERARMAEGMEPIDKSAFARRISDLLSRSL